MKKLLAFFSLFALLGNAFAKNYDLFFHDDGIHGLCVGLNSRGLDRRNIDGSKNCVINLSNDVRARVINPRPNNERKFGFDVVRPFFILDGIYLSADTLRTLESFYEETMQFGLTDMLVELGYTPILVQFSETVRKPLIENSFHFANLLYFVNNNGFFGFPNKMNDGMIVFGISQGGILGRYGAYRYDLLRKEGDAPIRIYGSLDSPHQGAVMPMGLLYTIDFWSKFGGSAEAEEFADLVNGPGASELLLANLVPGEYGHSFYGINLSDSRFLFGEYRKAADHKKYPSVLIAQGQMKGASSSHGETFYKLNRTAKKLGAVLGRAQSEMNTADTKTPTQISYNRVYEMRKKEAQTTVLDTITYDFVQGTTYPFAKKIYESLKSGFKSAMPDGMTRTVASLFGGDWKTEIKTSWDSDTLIQGFSTFIPTTSALDLNCGGDLSIRKGCAYTEKYSDVSFTNPGARSTATSMYAVDPTHPRYGEAVSGRHVELPVHSSVVIDTAVLRGMQVDIWRFLCEVANNDYDESTGSFRNENLAGVFYPKADCMDLTKMPDIIRNSGLNNVKKFAYARYDYNIYASEINDVVTFDVPAGWHKVAQFDNGSGISFNGNFAIDVVVSKTNSSWMKAELLLLKNKSGSGQLQLQEVVVPVDGSLHTLRWPIDFAENTTSHYRWFRLVLNSDGGTVTFSNPRFERSAVVAAEPAATMTPVVYPNNSVRTVPWTESTTLSAYSDGLSLDAKFKTIGSAFYMDFTEPKSIKNYKNVKVSYWPGTCQGTSVYFDSYKKGMVPLKNGVADGMFVSKIIPLTSVVDADIAPNNSLSASRIVFQSAKVDERCVVHSVVLE